MEDLFTEKDPAVETLLYLWHDNTLLEKFKIRREYFESIEHQRIFDVVSDCNRDKEQIIIEMRKINRSFFADNYLRMMELIPDEDSFLKIGRNLFEKYARKQLNKKFVDIRDMNGLDFLLGIQKTTDSLLDEAMKASLQGKLPLPVRAYAVDDLLPRLESEQMEGIHLKIFPDMNVPSGFRPCDMIALVGQAKAYKSYTALSMCKDFAEQGIKSCFIGYEQSADQNMFRYIQLETGIDQNVWTDKKQIIDNPIFGKYAINRLYMMQNIPLYVVDAYGDVHELMNTMKFYKKELGITFFAIDYINLIQSSSNNKNEKTEERTSYISRQLKSFSLKEKITTLVLTQFNRTGMRTGRITDISESAALLKDCDYIYSLRKPWAELEESDAFGKKPKNDLKMSINGTDYSLAKEDVVITLELSRNSVRGRRSVINWIKNVLLPVEIIHQETCAF